MSSSSVEFCVVLSDRYIQVSLFWGSCLACVSFEVKVCVQISCKNVVNKFCLQPDSIGSGLAVVLSLCNNSIYTLFPLLWGYRVFTLQPCCLLQMIEVVASMARGPVFLAGELMECLITFTNPMSHLSTSATRQDSPPFTSLLHIDTKIQPSVSTFIVYFAKQSASKSTIACVIKLYPLFWNFLSLGYTVLIVCF